MKNILSILLHFIFFTSLLFAQYPNIRVSSPGSTDPEEVSIAINPVNPQVLAAGANIKYFYYSTNGGMNWTQKLMSSSLGVWGDPCLIFDGLGYLYFGHLSNPISGYWIDRIVIQRSTDNGLTWNDGAGVGYTYPKNQDKEWLAVDMTTPQYKNFLYTSWTEFDNYGSSNSSDSSRILFSRSTDHGLSWSVPKRVSDKGGNCIDSDLTVEGAVPAVGPEGQIYIAWSGPLGIMFDKSVDGGITWGTDKFVTLHPGGWDFDVPGIYRANGLPVTVCDTSWSSTRGNVYVLWGDQRYGTDNSDVFIIKSTNQGQTWGPVIKVNNDNTTRHQFFPWVTIDQTTGFLYAVFYDRRNTSGTTTDVYAAKSTDGGETWDNFKISETPFTPSASIFFGDYTNIAAYNKKIYPIWMRLDNTTLSVWSTIITDSTIVPVELQDFSSSLVDGRIFLTWTTATELNNRGFEIERQYVSFSGEEGNWLNAGFVQGAGTTTDMKTYSWSEKPELNGIYRYRLKQVDFDGKYSYSNITEVSLLNDMKFELAQNYPNPFNPSTTISYQLSQPGEVILKVYDVLGNEVKTLVNSYQAAGVHETEFNAEGLVSGIYVYKIISGSFTDSRKMLLVK
jgi:hypothetical protein